MPERNSYRRQVLQAIESFLEGTPSSRVQAQHSIQHCFAELHTEAMEDTLDRMIWRSFVAPLTDSVYYESEEYLREVREILRGQSLQNLATIGIGDDFRPSFTAEEAEWYVQLVRMVDFLTAIPFAQIHAATFQAWQDRETWTTTRKIIPEALQAEEIEKQYQQRKALIEAIAARNPPPENMGEEKIYHFVLREITALITGMNVGGPAVYHGYPIPCVPYSGSSVDMSESILWSKRALEALSGNGGLLLSCRLSKASSFGADVLLISLH